MVTGPSGEKARAQHTTTADKGRPTKKRKGEKPLKSAKTDGTAKGILTAAAVENVTPAKAQVQSTTVVADPIANTQVPNTQVHSSPSSADGNTPHLSPTNSHVSPSEDITFSYDQHNNIIIPPSLSADTHPQQGSTPWGPPPTHNMAPPAQGTAPWGLPPTNHAQPASHAQGAAPWGLPPVHHTQLRTIAAWSLKTIALISC